MTLPKIILIRLWYDFRMNEHYALSVMQLKYLNGQDMPKSFNEPKERSRMLKKAQQAWSIFIPILRSNEVDQEFKDRVLLEKGDEDISYTVEDFFKYLVITSKDEPFEQIQHKIEFATMMVKHGFTFFQSRFGTNRLVADKIDEIEKVLFDLEDMVTQEQQNKEAFEIYRMRKRLSSPPTIRPEHYWKSECIHCYSFSLGISKTEKDSIETIKHDVNCRYVTEISKARKRNDVDSIDAINFQYIRTIPPISKKK